MPASPPVNLLGLSAMLSSPHTNATTLHEAGEAMRGRSRERRVLAKSPPQAIPEPRPAPPVVAEWFNSPVASPRLEALRRPSLQQAGRAAIGPTQPPQPTPRSTPVWLPLGSRRRSEDQQARLASPPSGLGSSPARGAEYERPESPFFGEMSPFGSRSPSVGGQERVTAVTRDDVLLAHRFLPVRIKVKNHPEWQIQVPAPHRKLHLLELNLGPSHFELLYAPQEVRRFYDELLAQAHGDWLTARERFSMLLFCAQNTAERGGNVAPDWLFLQGRDLLASLGRLRTRVGGGDNFRGAGEAS